ncbi:MAG: hypothetical protein EHM23_31165 [Acidobacteria bacterium]|nr:MAG: hypothetical protein EHM23_31165 [Acidobacteriota bacterium]
MKARYLFLTLAFACCALADEPQVLNDADLQTIAQEATAALKTSAAPQDVAANLRSRTYGKQVTVTGAGVTDLRDIDAFPVTSARPFTGVYTLGGKSYPDPSSMDGRRIAEVLHGFMSYATWGAEPERIRCSGAGLVVLNVKTDQKTFTYNLLATTYTFRRLRLGQRVSLEATISGVSIKNGNLDIFGVIKQVREP